MQAFLLEMPNLTIVEGEVAFPSTMVDRIVPATTEADRAAVSDRLGLWDAWPVVTEPFTQWVVEDRFPAGRPRLGEAGVRAEDILVSVVENGFEDWYAGRL